jgi:hypothetical protein
VSGGDRAKGEEKRQRNQPRKDAPAPTLP